MHNDPSLEEYRRHLEAAERELRDARRWLAEHEQSRARGDASRPSGPPRASQTPHLGQQPRPPHVAQTQQPLPQGAPQLQRQPQSSPQGQQEVHRHQQAFRQQPQPQARPQQPQARPQQLQQPQQPQQQQMPYQQQMQRQQHMQHLQTQHGQPLPQWQQRPPTPPKSPEEKEKTLIGVVAIAGTLITLVGIAFLVGMAIQAGLLGPLGRVVLAYMVSIALAGASLKFRGKAPEAGTTALLATSLYSALVTTLLVVTWLGWWPAWFGAIIMTMIYAAYVAFVHIKPEGFHSLTQMWLAIGMGFTAAVLTFTYGGSAWPAVFMPLVALVASALRKNDVLRGVGAVALFLVVAGLHLCDEPTPAAIKATAAGLSLVALVGLSVHFRTGVKTFGNIVAGFVVPVLMLILGTSQFNYEPATWITVACLAGVVVVAWGHTQGWIALGAVPLFYACSLMATRFDFYSDSMMNPSDDPVRVWGNLLLTALFYAALIALLPYLRHLVLHLTWAVSIMIVAYVPWAATLFSAGGFYEVPRLPIEAALLGAALGAAWVRRKTIYGVAGNKFYAAVVALFALVLSMIAVVGVVSGLGLVIGGYDLVQPAWYTGHAVVSVAWMMLAAFLLIKRQEGFTGLGILLAVVATLKLTFFDLAALPGIFRALAFLFSGIVLLVIAVYRVRSTPTVEPMKQPAQQEQQQNAAGPQQPQQPRS